MKRSNFSKTIPAFLFLIVCALIIWSCRQGTKPDPATEATTLKKGVILVDYREQRKVDIFIDGDVFTSYIYPENLEKPVLFPLRTAEGTIVTRGYPIEPREGESVDHPHQVGLWFNFGDVNGFDFWNNSSAIKAEEKDRYGRVLHRGVKRAESREAHGILEIAADWQVPEKNGNWHTLLQEKTIFKFSGDDKTRTIDRITQLTAQEKEVLFADNKEGLFAIRVARELEHPANEPLVLTDAMGMPMEEKVLDNEGVNGQYINSEGIKGIEVWGKRADWVCLSSAIGEEKLSIVIFDHPGNPGYPSYWMARGYGLFAVNNFGANVYNENADPVSLKLLPGESMTLKHRVHILSGDHALAEDMNRLFSEFARK